MFGWCDIWEVVDGAAKGLMLTTANLLVDNFLKF